MEKSKSKFVLWIENLWYHEKAKIIIFAVLIVSVAACLVQCINRAQPDIYLLYAGTDTLIQSEAVGIETKTSGFMPEDYNKDGELTVQFKQFLLEFGVSPSQEPLENELKLGNTVILFLSPSEYDYCTRNDMLISFSEVLGYTPEKANDDYSIDLFSLECASEMGVDMLPIDTMVCLAKPNFSYDENRTPEELVDRPMAANERIYSNQVKFFLHMLKHK